ncbi:protein split ends-like [Armigeres subalbatus]|uniref:protein split ends-like n=1 Tax=Armigeres subalbatus TaxID=124917 RepID=UPI002ED2781E
MEKKIIYESFQWFNKYVAINHEQLSAVRNIVNRTSFPAPYILFGPPGTGKTSTIVEAVLQIWKLQPKANVLVPAASNFACDEFTTRLLEFIPATDVFRFVSFVSILLITEQHLRSQRAVEVLRKVVSIVAAPTTNIRKAVHHTRKIHRTAMVEVEDRSAAVEDSADVVVSVAVFIVMAHRTTGTMMNGVDQESMANMIHAVVREPGIDRSSSRSPRRRSPADSDSSSCMNGMLSNARTLPEVARKSTTLHLTDGDHEIVDSLMKDEEGKHHLRITQRLRLDQPKLENLQKRISTSSSHAIFLGLLGSTSSVASSDDVSVQTRPLRNLVSYLKQKEAAGVISLLNKETEATDVLYSFPPCDFSTELLKRTCHNLTEEGLKEDHLVIVVVRGGTIL